MEAPAPTRQPRRRRTWVRRNAIRGAITAATLYAGLLACCMIYDHGSHAWVSLSNIFAGYAVLPILLILPAEYTRFLVFGGILCWAAIGASIGTALGLARK